MNDPSTSGLIISHLLPLCTLTRLVFNPLVSFFKCGVSIQRIYDYINTKTFEREFFSPKAPQNWPTTGVIKAKNLSVRYRKDLPLVLKNINLDIKHGEKVAIIGRTGSGKSTSLLAFMRILEMARNSRNAPTGYIEIDGVDISKLGLHELRGNIAIIPQEPLLVEGTLRSNIDMLDQYSDEEVAEALDYVSILETIKIETIIKQKIEALKSKEKKKFRIMDRAKKIKILKKFKTEEKFINSTVKVDEDKDIRRIKQTGATTKDKLGLKIESKGENISIGQRQLICIARALVKKPKILLMDEATANIDQKTDSVIQNLIKMNLSHTTVVTIAHRLITIVQYDKVFIFEAGVKIEEGSPAKLLSDRDSRFSGMVLESGKDFYEKMIVAAEDKEVDPAELFAR